MDVVAKLDEYGKSAWIAAMVAGFIIFWPAGLAILGYMIWSGRMGCRHKAERWWKNAAGKGKQAWSGSERSSGNLAFDEYREETLRRLEEEQEEFMGFLDRLRKAKDKAEFDQFMNEQRNKRHPDANGDDAAAPA